MNMNDPTVRASVRYGWTMLAVFMLGGLTLALLLSIKFSPYIAVPIRRELWALAHAHGALLALINLPFAAFAPACIPDERKRRFAGFMLRWGSFIMPLGFFLGGLWPSTEGEPSPLIALVFLGGLMVIHAMAACAAGAWRAGNAAT
ncbi:MAG: hypothetical protein ACRESS_02335 [Stenotrophobium sp.]